jgi:hypothetical protein
MPFTRFIDGTRPLFMTSVFDGGVCVLWKSLYSTVVARASRYVRRVSPEGAKVGTTWPSASASISSSRQRKLSPAGAR